MGKEIAVTCDTTKVFDLISSVVDTKDMISVKYCIKRICNNYLSVEQLSEFVDTTMPDDYVICTDNIHRLLLELEVKYAIVDGITENVYLLVKNTDPDNLLKFNIYSDCGCVYDSIAYSIKSSVNTISMCKFDTNTLCPSKYFILSANTYMEDTDEQYVQPPVDFSYRLLKYLGDIIHQNFKNIQAL